MTNPLYIFSEEQGNLLIRLVLAHVVADFALQSDKMARAKAWFSRLFLLHITLVFALTYLFTGLWQLALLLMLSHWLIDGLRRNIQLKYETKEYVFFPLGQLFHIATILVLWAYKFNLFDACLKAIKLPLLDYKLSLYLLSYALVTWPLGYLIKLGLEKMQLLSQTTNNTATETGSTANENIKNAGKRIGQFERIIILTFVLLGQYEAIGFLITGKSIIRFADRNSELKSEYVLVGTMMSYGLSILIGILTMFLLNHQ